MDHSRVAVLLQDAASTCKAAPQNKTLVLTCLVLPWTLFSLPMSVLSTQSYHISNTTDDCYQPLVLCQIKFCPFSTNSWPPQQHGCSLWMAIWAVLRSVRRNAVAFVMSGLLCHPPANPKISSFSFLPALEGQEERVFLGSDGVRWALGTCVVVYMQLGHSKHESWS